MKKLIYAICLIMPAIYLPITAGAQWMVQSESPSMALGQLNVLNDSTLFVTGYNGPYIQKSTNSGVSWDTISFSNARSFKIQFLNDSVGFVGGQADFIVGPTYFKTLDGGQSWQPMNFATGGGIPYHSLFFLDKDTGFVTFAAGLYKTTNGGDSFDLINLPDSITFLSEIYFTNKQEGFVTGWLMHNSHNFNNIIFKTTNQGASWTEVYRDTLTVPPPFIYPGLKEIYFYGQQKGFVAGLPGYYLHTTNGGDTWTKTEIDQDKTMSNFDFVTADTGYAILWPDFVKTTDGGMSWNTMPTPFGTDPLDVQFLNAQVGYISGHKVCKTTTGTTGIIQKSITSKIKISPNPAKNIINLQYNNLHIQSLTLTDLSGRTVKSFPAESKRLKVSGLAAGLYFLQIRAKEGAMTEKVEIR